jgi:hypothetical protein
VPSHKLDLRRRASRNSRDRHRSTRCDVTYTGVVAELDWNADWGKSATARTCVKLTPKRIPGECVANFVADRRIQNARDSGLEVDRTLSKRRRSGEQGSQCD